MSSFTVRVSLALLMPTICLSQHGVCPGFADSCQTDADCQAKGCKECQQRGGLFGPFCSDGVEKTTATQVGKAQVCSGFADSCKTDADCQAKGCKVCQQRGGLFGPFCSDGVAKTCPGFKKSCNTDADCASLGCQTCQKTGGVYGNWCDGLATGSVDAGNSSATMEIFTAVAHAAVPEPSEGIRQIEGEGKESSVDSQGWCIAEFEACDPDAWQPWAQCCQPGGPVGTLKCCNAGDDEWVCASASGGICNPAQTKGAAVAEMMV